MAYDEQLAARAREVLGERARFDELKMFGGLCFTVNGNMVLGVVNQDLMVRVGADAHDVAIRKPGARLMDFTKKPMKGFLFVDARGTKGKRALAQWADLSLAYVETLPPKKAKKKTKPTKR